MVMYLQNRKCEGGSAGMGISKFRQTSESPYSIFPREYSATVLTTSCINLPPMHKVNKNPFASDKIFTTTALYLGVLISGTKRSRLEQLDLGPAHRLIGLVVDLCIDSELLTRDESGPVQAHCSRDGAALAA